MDVLIIVLKVIGALAALAYLYVVFQLIVPLVALPSARASNESQLKMLLIILTWPVSFIYTAHKERNFQRDCHHDWEDFDEGRFCAICDVSWEKWKEWEEWKQQEKDNG